MTPSTPFVWTTKARNLEWFRGRVSAYIPPSMIVKRDRWEIQRGEILAELNACEWPVMIVRSSVSNEDTTGSSSAGVYASALDVTGTDQLAVAIDEVFASYGERCGRDEELFIQPMLQDSVLSGVASGRDHLGGGPYRVINWTRGRDTSAVTSGGAVNVAAWFGLRGGDDIAPAPPELAGVVGLLDEVIALLNTDLVEIEFAQSRSHGPTLLQVRPLTGVHVINDDEARGAALAARAAIDTLGRRRDARLGSGSLLGVMPDWNPAEMIGLRPRPLSASLYRRLITTQVWSQARRDLGYRDLTGVELMPDIAGIPYIDVRASLSSLVPAELSDNIAARWVASATHRLANRPELHDKIEFEVMVSAWGPLASQRLAERFGGALSRRELSAIEDSLLSRTSDLLGDPQRISIDLRRVAGLSAALDQSPHSWAVRADRLAADGTLPFARLARIAFVATDLAEQLVAAGAFDRDLRDDIIGSAGKVASDLLSSLTTASRAEFLSEYGHLRPGTYDITSLRYDEDPGLYFPDSLRQAPSPTKLARRESRSVAKADVDRIDAALRTQGLPLSGTDFLGFLRAAVSAREQSKFWFTRELSALLSSVSSGLAEFGLDRETVSYLTWEQIAAQKIDPLRLREAAKRGKAQHEVVRRVALPMLISSSSEVLAFEAQQSTPNFITTTSVEGEVAQVDAGESPDGRIAAIVSADPGYDWIFTRGIVGLVTAFGGANSHMAIRAREFGIPSVIGSGLDAFGRWASARRLQIDCATQSVRILA